jgi:hypothetical protein
MAVTDNTPQVLLLGPHDAGKTTLLIQLYGRLAHGGGALESAEAPKHLGAIQAGLQRLQRGLSVEHTSHGTDEALALPAIDADGHRVELRIPEYAGEDLELFVKERRLGSQWRDLASASDRWLLLARPSAEPELVDVLNMPIGEIAAAVISDSAVDELPLDMWMVELLQTLLYARRVSLGERPLPELGVVITCWDELAQSGRPDPGAVVSSRLPLLASYCRSIWPDDKFAFFGLSALGRGLDKDKPDPEFMNKGPQAMGFAVLPDGSQTTDLTRLIRP